MESLKIMANGAWVGTVIHYPQGYKFISRVSSIGNSRVFHDRAQNAVPKKLGKWIYG